MGEDLREILQDSSNEAHIENKHYQGSKVDIGKADDETEESALQSEDDGRKNRQYNQSDFFL
jgi:hypothetical protein